jgi:hypothetical protein
MDLFEMTLKLKKVVVHLSRLQVLEYGRSRMTVLGRKSLESHKLSSSR